MKFSKETNIILGKILEERPKKGRILENLKLLYDLKTTLGTNVVELEVMTPKFKLYKVKPIQYM